MQSYNSKNTQICTTNFLLNKIHDWLLRSIFEHYEINWSLHYLTSSKNILDVALFKDSYIYLLLSLHYLNCEVRYWKAEKNYFKYLIDAHYS